MKATNVWRVMTPIKARFGYMRWYRPLIVAQYEHEAVRVADQDAGAAGFEFDGDIKVQHVANATTEDG